MNLKRRSLSVIMAMMLTMSVFSGCASNAAKPAATSSQDTQNQQPLKFSQTVFGATSDYVMKQPDINQDKWLKALDKQFNVDLQLKMIDDKNRDQQMQMMIASGDIPDVVLGMGDVNYVGLAGAVQAGVFLDITDLLKKNVDKWTYINQIPKNSWDFGQVDGKQYGIPVQYLSIATRRATYIRKDLLDKTGLKAPTNLDETLNVLRAFKKLGVKYPYAGRSKWEYTDIFFGAFGVSQFNQWNLDKDKNMVPDIIRPEMKDALKFLAQLNKEGLIDPETLTTDSTSWGNKINAGDVGMWDQNAGNLSGYVTTVKQNVPTAEVILIPSPAGPKGNKGMYKYMPVNVMAYINKKAKEPERILKLIDDELSPAGREYFAFGVEGETYTKTNGKIDWKYPTDKPSMDEMSWRTNSLGTARDDAYNKLQLPFQPSGQLIMDWFDKIAPNEGLDNYIPKDKLKSIDAHPDLDPKSNSLFMDASAKIFLGQGNADQVFDDYVKTYMQRGGSEVVKEATDMYKAGKFILIK